MTVLLKNNRSLKKILAEYKFIDASQQKNISLGFEKRSRLCPKTQELVSITEEKFMKEKEFFALDISESKKEEYLSKENQVLKALLAKRIVDGELLNSFQKMKNVQSLRNDVESRQQNFDNKIRTLQRATQGHKSELDAAKGEAREEIDSFQESVDALKGLMGQATEFPNKGLDSDLMTIFEDVRQKYKNLNKKQKTAHKHKTKFDKRQRLLVSLDAGSPRLEKAKKSLKKLRDALAESLKPFVSAKVFGTFKEQLFEDN